MIRLIALDIDHTLVGADQCIAPADLSAIHRCMDEGVEIVLATGRTRPTTEPIIEQVGRPVAAICNTGGITYDEAGNILQRLTLPLELAKEMLRRMQEDGVWFRVDVGEQTYVPEPPAEWFSSRWPVVHPDVASILDTPPDQLLVFGREACRWVLREFSYLAGDVQLLVLPSFDEPDVIHILHPRATKGAALADYCRRRGVARAEVVAFGDSLNDLTMLSFAGFSVAVADSDPRLHVVADKVMKPGETLADVLLQLMEMRPR